MKSTNNHICTPTYNEHDWLYGHGLKSSKACHIICSGCKGHIAWVNNDDKEALISMLGNSYIREKLNKKLKEVKNGRTS